MKCYGCSFIFPPCATFSKARDRCWRTRVRSWAQPAGIQPVSAKVCKANVIAKQAILFARWAAETLGATVTMGNPDFSYLWIYGTPYFGSHTKYRDTRMSYCRYGKAYKKNTRFRTWNGDFSKLNRLCTTKNGRHSCGNEFHTHLEFGGIPTSEAAAYPVSLCEQYTRSVEETVHSRVPTSDSAPFGR